MLNNKDDFDYCALPDYQKNWIRQYESWCKSDAPTTYRMNMIEYYYKLLASEKLLKYVYSEEYYKDK